MYSLNNLQLDMKGKFFSKYNFGKVLKYQKQILKLLDGPSMVK